MNYTFYYDETNNHRKFYLKNKRFNIKDSNQNFVLGGVVAISEDINFDIKKFKKDIKLQKNAKEVKFDNIEKGDFLKSLSSKRFNTFLNYLNNSSLYVHYSNINIIYWSIVDIIDSLVLDIENYDFQILPLLKNELYKIVSNDKNKFIDILYSFEYPNIKDDKLKLFIDAILTFIQLNKKDNVNKDICLEIELLLFNALKSDELVFIMNEKDNMLIDNFFNFYTRPLELFNSSYHIFDEEDSIEKLFSCNKLYLDEKSIDNFTFKDSEDEELIQLSDIWAVFLGKYFSYLNSIKDEDIYTIKNNFNNMQKDNIELLKQIIMKTERFNGMFFHSIVPLDYFIKNSIFLDLEK